MRRVRLPLWSGLAALAVMGGCGRDAVRQGPVVTVRDSAGVEIVESSAPEWGSAEGWSTSTEPVVEIGAPEGDPAYVLFGVRYVHRLSDGRIAIANAGTSEVRIYAPDGTHLLDFGREGDGPGEFRFLGRVWPVWGDSIMTYDSRLSRASIHDREGTLGRTVSIRPEDGASQAFVLRPALDGTLFVEGVVRGDPPRPGLFDGGARRYWRYSAEGEPLNRIGERPVPSQWGFTSEGSLGYTSAPFHVIFPPATSDGISIFIGTGEQPSIEQRGADGTLRRLVRWSYEPRPVTADLEEMYRDWRLGLSNEPRLRPMVEASLDGIVFPDRMPTYRRLLADAEGYLWVERYRPLWDEERRWWVFEPSGRWLGEPSVPGDLDIRDIGRDYILGIHRDASDVERVRMYALRR